MSVHANVRTYVPDMPNNTKQNNAALELFFTAEQRERRICPSNTPIWRENQNMLAELKYKKKNSYNKC